MCHASNGIWFLPFDFLNAFIKFQKVLDLVLTSFNFFKCYTNDIIIFNLILRDPMQHLQKVFGNVLTHNFKLHLGKCWFFQIQVEYMVHMVYLSGLRVQKAKAQAISQVTQPTNVSRLWVFFNLCNYYRIFIIEGFNNIVKPLTQLMKIDKNTFESRHKNKPFKCWSQTHISFHFTITHARTTFSITH
jgi:hypothetical protein